MDAELVVLAAGASSRMGHPKALTRLGEETALERIARVAAEAGVARLVVVTGADDAAVRAAHPQLEARWVRNPSPEMGRTGSLQRGLQACRTSAVLVLPVDHPLIAAVTMRLLAAHPDAWVVPVHGGRGGHPIKLGEMGIAAALTAPPGVPLRDVPRMVGIEPTRVEVADAGVLANLDTPEDVERARAQAPDLSHL